MLRRAFAVGPRTNCLWRNCRPWKKPTRWCARRWPWLCTIGTTPILARWNKYSAAWRGKSSSRVSSGNPKALIARLHQVLFDERGFTGNADDYYAPENSYLPCVLESRRGIPVTLSLIYKSVAQRVGLSARGINTPAHFLGVGGSQRLVDDRGPV